MSEYIPTTEEVRRGYSWNQLSNSYGVNNGKEFDRWLDEVKAQAWDEGFREGLDGDRGDPNPYRKVVK